MTRSKWYSAAALATSAALIAGCAPAASRPGSVPPSPAPSSAAPEVASPSPPAEAADTIVRFRNDVAHVDVVIGEDTPAVRDFLSLLPLQVSFEEFGGREKISYLPRELEWSGSPGSDPQDGDLIYFTPWGNLGFYYDASGIGYSDATLHLGTFSASRDVLDALHGQVTVEIHEQ